MSLKLPPLPLVDSPDGPVFLCDNSSLEKLVCPRLWQLVNLNRRTLVESRAGRNFGAGLHVGLKERYSLCGHNEVTPDKTKIINSAISEFFRSSPQPVDDFRTLEHCQRVMQAYNEYYRSEPFKILQRPDGKPAVESSFSFPLGKVDEVMVYYIGRMDMNIEDNTGEWVFDHKTAFMFGDGFRRSLERNAGQIGYCWAHQQIYGRLPRGYVIDAIRIRRPKKGDEYTGAPPIDSSDLQRIPYFIMPDNVEYWKQNTLRKIENIFLMHSVGYFYQNESQCETKYGPCDFYDLCSAPESSWDEILNSTRYEHNDWSPLNLPTKGE